MHYCSNCASPVEFTVPPDDDRPRFVCKNCNTVHYQNPRLVVGCIPVWKDQILLCLRDIEPRRGKWTLPAGYLENGETVKAGACRETLEETGAQPDHLEPYLLFDIAHINQLYLMFRARLRSPDFHRTKESAQVRLFDAQAIPWDEIAFPVIEETLRIYLADHPGGRFPFQIHPILTKMKHD